LCIGPLPKPEAEPLLGRSTHFGRNTPSTR
jgi:hypothetical protein